MDPEHELAEDWHHRDVAPETVLIVSLGALLGLGFVTQVTRQAANPVVPLVLMGIITLGTMIAWQSTLAQHVFVSRAP